MEEQRRVQEAEVSRSAGSESAQRNPSTIAESAGEIHSFILL